MGSPGEKCTFFQFLSVVHAKVANSNPTNYIFPRSAINTLSIEHIKSPFFKNLKIRLEYLLTWHLSEHLVNEDLGTKRLVDKLVVDLWMVTHDR